MSRRRQIENSLASLREIREILNAMKNTALTQVRRLNRFLLAQQRVVAAIEDAGSDFASFYPDLFSFGAPSRNVILLVGSERGFCGDFNEALIRQLDRNSAETIVVGSRLQDHLPEGFEVAATLENASTVEEVDRVFVHLTDTLSRLMSAQGRLRSPQVRVIHHQAAGQDVREAVLQPMRAGPDASSKFAFPPDLTLDPPAFAEGLIEQYLFARLHELLYSSLMVENQVRVQHMEAAVERLDRSFSELTRRRNILRQEEITQEIEVIMLSAGAFG